MNTYREPYRDADFVIRHLLAFDQWSKVAADEGIDSDFAAEVFRQAANFSRTHLLPLNRSGDLDGAKLTAKGVTESPGFAAAYRAFTEQGWPSLAGPPAYGGQGLSHLISVSCNEIWNSSNMAFALCPLLSQGAIAALLQHGSPTLKERYLQKLISGQWCGTMNLTEAGAGSDLALIKTSARPCDEHYEIRGQKVFITWGDHQMAENILHLVLARIEDAPAGVKGISLFIVPKYLPVAKGKGIVANGIKCIGVEDKLGIHASPTCVMSFGDEEVAVGYLVGEANGGLKAMFTMMNHARQAVGVQGLALSEAALQQAVEYAYQREQGSDEQGRTVTILEHPDIQRMLLSMQAATQAMRALCYYSAFIEDRKSGGVAELPALAAFVTPLVKAWCTELAQEVVSTGLQVHGGAGYIEETGIAQLFRDARILPIYEGTTAIQALDFIQRKTLYDKGVCARYLLAEMDVLMTQLAKSVALNKIECAVIRAVQDARAALHWVLTHPEQAKAVAQSYLMLWGYLTAGWLMAKSALLASAQLKKEKEDEFLQAKLRAAQFYMEHYLIKTSVLLARVRAGEQSLAGVSYQQLLSHVN